MSGHKHAPLASIVRNGYKGKSLHPSESVWNLNLDQIESGTGRILGKHIVKASELGTSTYQFEAGTVLYSKLRPYLNKVAIANEDGAATTELVPLRCDPEKILPKYLAYYLRAPRFLSFANVVVAGAKMPRMVMSEFWKHEIPLPPLEDQRRIAAILEKADQVRAKRNEALALLDKLAQSIFVEMFGDPVANPKQWPAGVLADFVSEMQYGPRFYNEAYSSDGIRIVRITDLDASGNLDFDAMPKMSIDEEAHEQFILQAGDVIFARTGATVGKVALISESAPPCIAGAYFIRMRFGEAVLPEYALAVLQSKSVQALVAKQSRQAAQQNFSGPGLRRLPMPLPPLHLQMRYKERVERMKKEIVMHRQSVSVLNTMFESLQHHAFRGDP
jgi:type I restriction enzyme, S subunit